jgi:hypothetical protein
VPTTNFSAAISIFLPIPVSPLRKNRRLLSQPRLAGQRHWHAKEDEFVYVLSGEVVLVTLQTWVGVWSFEASVHTARARTGHPRLAWRAPQAGHSPQPGSSPSRYRSYLSHP